MSARENAIPPVILHVSADYPDAFNPNKTRAVKYLLDAAVGFRHAVYSINRVNGWRGVVEAREEGGVTALRYHAPPYGVAMQSALAPVADWIAADARRRGLAVAAVQAHKLTVDGLVGLRLAEAFGAPLVCNVWGDTDQKIIAARPDLRPAFRRILSRAALVLPATPWARDYVLDALGGDAAKFHVLPVIAKVGAPMASVASDRGLVSVLHLDSYRRKNIPRLIEALRLLKEQGGAPRLSLYGGGGPRSLEALNRLIRRAGLEGMVALKGAVAQADVSGIVNQYQAFILPSRRESFGMAFIEALYAGVPIVYPRGQAVDGFFDDADVGEKCDARSAPDIVRAIRRVLARETDLKRAIAALREAEVLTQFAPARIVGRYTAMLNEICGRGAALERTLAHGGA